MFSFKLIKLCWSHHKNFEHDPITVKMFKEVYFLKIIFKIIEKNQQLRCGKKQQWMESRIRLNNEAMKSSRWFCVAIYCEITSNKSALQSNSILFQQLTCDTNLETANTLQTLCLFSSIPYFNSHCAASWPCISKGLIWRCTRKTRPCPL